MNRFSNVMIASDIDGTVAVHGRIPQCNIDSLKYFISGGGLFSFSSGRNHRDIWMLIPDLAELVSMPNVLCNGGMLYDAATDTISNAVYLDRAASAHAFAETSRRFPDVGFRVSADTGFVTLSDGIEKVYSQLPPGLHKIISAAPEDELENTGGNWYKAVFFDEPEPLIRVTEFMQREYADLFDFTSSGPKLLEIVPKGVSKANQVNYLKQLYGKDRPGLRLFCIGDYINDLEMLACADIAVCPQNACDEIKAISALTVCDCAQGALCDLIGRIDRGLV